MCSMGYRVLVDLFVMMNLKKTVVLVFATIATYVRKWVIRLGLNPLIGNDKKRLWWPARLVKESWEPVLAWKQLVSMENMNLRKNFKQQKTGGLPTYKHPKKISALTWLYSIIKTLPKFYQNKSTHIPLSIFLTGLYSLIYQKTVDMLSFNSIMLEHNYSSIPYY